MKTPVHHIAFALAALAAPALSQSTIRITAGLGGAEPNGDSGEVQISGDGRKALSRLRKRKTAYLAKKMRALPDDDVATLARAAEILEQVLEEGRS